MKYANKFYSFQISKMPLFNFFIQNQRKLFGWKIIHLILLIITTWNPVFASSVNLEITNTFSQSFPPQVRLEVPYGPTSFPANGRNHLLYELLITNFEGYAISLDHVDILDSKKADDSLLVRFSEKSLNNIVKGMNMGDSDEPIVISSGATIVLFMSVDLPLGRPIPEKLLHYVHLSDNRFVKGDLVGTQQTMVKELVPPVQGDNWLARNGPSNGLYNHHRRGIFIVNGALRNSRRLAIDWKPIINNVPYSGNSKVVESYYAYGKPVYAVADATVVKIVDGLPDNPPGHNENFHPTLPVTFDNAGGNTIVLDLGDGQFAHYYHLKSGSILVKEGQHVKSGEHIAQIGASGDAREPHLHFEVSTSIQLLTGEGIPYIIDEFKVTGGEEYNYGVHKKEMPIDGMIINFSQKIKN